MKWILKKWKLYTLAGTSTQRNHLQYGQYRQPKMHTVSKTNMRILWEFLTTGGWKIRKFFVKSKLCAFHLLPTNYICFLMYSPLSCHFTKFYCQTKFVFNLFCMSFPILPQLLQLFPIHRRCPWNFPATTFYRIQSAAEIRLPSRTSSSTGNREQPWSAISDFVLLPLFIWVSCWLTDHQFMGFVFKVHLIKSWKPVENINGQAERSCAEAPRCPKICWNTEHVWQVSYIYIYIYTLWIQTPPEKVLNPPNHVPNTS